jgi:hypothetical protein
MCVIWFKRALTTISDKTISLNLSVSWLASKFKHLILWYIQKKVLIYQTKQKMISNITYIRYGITYSVV